MQPGDRKHAHERQEEALAGAAATPFEGSVPHATGEPSRRIRWHFTTLPGGSGPLLCAIGFDVTEALHRPPSVSGRLRHVAHLGVRTRNFAFQQHGLAPPAEEFRVELIGPDGDIWSWGPEDAAQRVTGPALDFCLRVTRRRNRADLTLEATGPDADRWLDVAQAFAGPPGAERPPAHRPSPDGGA